VVTVVVVVAVVVVVVAVEAAVVASLTELGAEFIQYIQQQINIEHRSWAGVVE
jgi:predicted PurR-regulated permease PerM